jgi:phage baseplate assembly protein W
VITGGGNYSTWALNPTPPAVASAAPAAVVPPATQLSFLGYGLVTPFRRGMANDFAAAGAENLVRSRVSQILGTQAGGKTDAGELAWRGEFGVRLNHLRHRTKTPMLEKMAQHYVMDAFARWEPCARVSSAKVLRAPSQPRTLTLRVVYDVVVTNPSGNPVIFPGQTLDVQINPTAG